MLCNEGGADHLREAARAREGEAALDGPGAGNARKARPHPAPGAQRRALSHRMGTVTFTTVKGEITVANGELEIRLLRPNGIPTYNFGVVVDDIDMDITHVIRGDDHVNNTPRQINIYRALAARLPQFAHVPMILGQDGERLSKRHGAVSVMQYRDDGYLPEALVNYLARLGGRTETRRCSREQLVEWFDLEHVSKSPARFDPEKLAWLNGQYLKRADGARLAELAAPFLAAHGCDTRNGPPLDKVMALLKERAATVKELAEAAVYFYRPREPSKQLQREHPPRSGS